MTENTKTKGMSEKERLELCQKLDRELDDFINGLERKRYEEGWPEDRWEEEMDKHPFFMKSNPESDEMSPLAEGLAKLKYDPDENTPLELAINYKEDGNFNFKHKNYRLAILSYTEGIRVRCDCPEINASLYNNRAACHWYLKNYRSCLIDSEKALKFIPDHTKARIRAAKSACEIGKYDISIAHCNIVMEKFADDKEIGEILNKVKKRKLIKDRDERKKNKSLLKQEEEKEMLIKEIVKRGIRIIHCEDEDDIDLSKLEPCLPGAHSSIVHLENGLLVWPVLFMYPEYQTTDFVQNFTENISIWNQLEQLFPAPWDEKNEYETHKVNVYFEGYDKMPHVVDLLKNLGDVLTMKYFELRAGTPAFFVVPRGSHVEKSFLETYI